MTKLLSSQTNFNAGELSPRLYGRIDISKYANGLQTATNAFVTPHGPIIRRTGSQYIAEVRDSSSSVRLLRFQFNQDDAFILEFGNEYIRFYTGSAQVQEADVTITGITQANPGVVTATAHGFSNGDQVFISGVVGMTEVNGFRFTVANVTANTFELSGTDTSGYTAYSSGGVANRIYTVTSPYSASEVDSISYIQFGDFIYLAHPSYAPRKLTRLGTTNWTLEELELLPPPTVELGEYPNGTLTPGATTGSGVTFTSSVSTFVDADIGRQLINESGTGRAAITAVSSATQVTADIVEDFPSTSAISANSWRLDLSPIADLTSDLTKSGSIATVSADLASSTTAVNTFRSTDVGRYILMNGGVLQITAFNSASEVEAEILKSLNNSDETGNWTLEDPTWSSARGYPRAVGLYQERLVFGGTEAQPQTLWFSEQSIFDGFGAGPDDEDSIEVDLSSSQVNQINWIAVARELVVGTSGTESTVSGGGASAISPSNIQQTPRTYYGSNTQTPIIVGNEVIFNQRSQRKTRTFKYDFNIDGYTGEDLHFLAEHVTSGLIKEIAYAQEPDSILYAVLENGDMLAGTYNREQQVIGWCTYQTTGSYENVQTITVGEVDQVWCVVKRTINGITKRYIELFETGDGSDRTHGYSDSFLVYSDPKTVSGITQANPGVVTATAHGFSNGDLVKLISVSGMTEVNGKTYRVANAATNTFELTTTAGSNVDTSSFMSYTSGGEAHKLVTTISGLDHLEGVTVQVKADGSTHPNKTVSSGSITLDRNSYEVVVGLPYTTTIKTLRKDFEIGQGPMQGQRSRWSRPIVRVNLSTKPLVNGEFLPSRSAGDQMDSAVPLFTGDLEYGPLTWGNTGQITLTVSDPLPLQLIGIFGALEGNIK